jgi:hypothetical protein
MIEEAFEGDLEMKTTFIVCLLAAVLTFGGCDIKAPGQASMEKPKLSALQREIYNRLKDIAGKDYKLAAALEGDHKGGIQLVDIDGDGQEEAVIFYTRGNTDPAVNMLVLDAGAGKWESIGDIKSSAYQVNKVDYEDMTGDGNKDIVVGWQLSDGFQKGMGIYSFQSGQVREIFTNLCTAEIVADFDGDRQGELLLTKHDREKYTGQAELYKYRAGKMELLHATAMDGGINSIESVQLGMASADQQGVFIDMGVGAHSATTALLIVKEGKIHNVFYSGIGEVNEKTFKPYPFNCLDIDGDGIMEIPIQIPAPGYENAPMVATQWITNWYKWDGKGDIALSGQNFYNYIDGYFINIPEHWKNLVTMERVGEGQGEEKVVYGYYEQSSGKTYPLFEIVACGVSTWEQGRPEGMTELGRYLNKVYGLRLLPAEQLPKEVQKLSVSQASVKANFHAISTNSLGQ